MKKLKREVDEQLAKNIVYRRLLFLKKDALYRNIYNSFNISRGNEKRGQGYLQNKLYLKHLRGRGRCSFHVYSRIEYLNVPLVRATDFHVNASLVEKHSSSSELI